MKNFIMNELKKYEFKYNADVRKAIAQTLKANFGAYPSPHDLCLKDWAPVIKAAIKVGGAVHGTKYAYRNAQGATSVAKVYDLYDIPFGLVNPVLVCFSGYMPAAIYTLEAFRAYYNKYNEYLPIAATGKGGNKGLFEEVFNRDKGLMIHSEAEAYMRILEEVLAYDWVRQFQREISDTDTKGNFAELYHLAKSKEWKEVTFILCSGQPWYTKRLLAEGMLEFGKPEPLLAFCKALQHNSPIESYLTPIPDEVPGYDDKLIMAGGSFIEGSTIELSADGPMRPPYAAYMQGGLNYAHVKIALDGVLKELGL